MAVRGQGLISLTLMESVYCRRKLCFWGVNPFYFVGMNQGCAAMMEVIEASVTASMWFEFFRSAQCELAVGRYSGTGRLCKKAHSKVYLRWSR